MKANINDVVNIVMNELRRGKISKSTLNSDVYELVHSKLADTSFYCNGSPIACDAIWRYFADHGGRLDGIGSNFFSDRDSCYYINEFGVVMRTKPDSKILDGKTFIQ